jgi:very-short-patch-repair endonuclease
MADERLASPMRKRASPRCDREVARRAAEQWGVMSTQELLECGMTHPAISRRARRGRLHQLHTGVWAVGHANPPWEGRMLAAIKACGPGAVLSHRSAAELWGFLERSDRSAEVTVVGKRGRQLPEIVGHRTSYLEPRDRTRFEGIPVTAPPRTLIDIAGVHTDAELRHAVRRAQGLRRLNVRQLLEAIERLGPRRGCARLREAIASGPAPTRSALEDVVLDLLLAGGFEHPDVNRPLVIEGRRVIPDFRWAEQRLILEADGAAWHDNAIARKEDTERQALLEAGGERVIRVTWHQAVTRSAETVARIRAAGAPLADEGRLASPIRK